MFTTKITVKPHCTDMYVENLQEALFNFHLNLDSHKEQFGIYRLICIF